MDDGYERLREDQDAYHILKALRAAAGEFVSGNVLADTLGVSRPAVWGKLEKLREQGFQIEAVRKRGYRLTGVPLRLHPTPCDWRRSNAARRSRHCIIHASTALTTKPSGRRRSAVPGPLPSSPVARPRAAGALGGMVQRIGR